MIYKFENYIEDLDAVEILSKVITKNIARMLMETHINCGNMPDTRSIAEFEDQQDGTTIATVHKFMGKPLDTTKEHSKFLITYKTDDYTLQSVEYIKDDRSLYNAVFKTIEIKGVKIDTIILTEDNKTNICIEFDATNATGSKCLYIDQWYTQIPLFKPNSILKQYEKEAIDLIKDYISQSSIDFTHCDRLVYSENNISLWNIFFGVRGSKNQRQVSLYSGNDCFFDVSIEQNEQGKYELLHYKYIDTRRNNPPIHIYVDTEITKPNDLVSGSFANNIAYRITDRSQFFADSINNSTTVVTCSTVSKENASKEEFGFDPYTVRKLLSDPHFYKIANVDNKKVFNAAESIHLSEDEGRCDITLEVEEYDKNPESEHIIAKRLYTYEKDENVDVSKWKYDIDDLVSEYAYFGVFDQFRLKAPEGYSLKSITCEDDGNFTAKFNTRYLLPGDLKLYYSDNTLVGDYKVTFPQNGMRLQHDRHYYIVKTKDQLIAEGVRETIQSDLWISPLSSDIYLGTEVILRKDKDGNEFYDSYESVSGEEDICNLENKVLLQAQVIIDSQDKTPKVK